MKTTPIFRFGTARRWLSASFAWLSRHRRVKGDGARVMTKYGSITLHIDFFLLFCCAFSIFARNRRINSVKEVQEGTFIYKKALTRTHTRNRTATVWHSTNLSSCKKNEEQNREDDVHRKWNPKIWNVKGNKRTKWNDPKEGRKEGKKCARSSSYTNVPMCHLHRGKSVQVFASRRTRYCTALCTDGHRRKIELWDNTIDRF